MSRILRRPMFRGGRVSSYGTGIASGLADGGRVGYADAGAVTGGDLLRRQGWQWDPLPRMQNYLVPGARGVKPGDMDWWNQLITRQNLEKLQSSVADEVQVTEDLESQDPYQGSRSELFTPRKQVIDDVNILEPAEFTSDAELEDESAVPTIPETKGRVFDVKDPLAYAESTGVPAGVRINEGEVVIEEDSGIEAMADKYFALMGGEKAWKQDAADMAMLASAKLLKPGATVRSGLGEFMEVEAAKGPGRAETLKKESTKFAITQDIQTKLLDKKIEAQKEIADKNLIATIAKLDKDGQYKKKVDDIIDDRFGGDETKRAEASRIALGDHSTIEAAIYDATKGGMPMTPATFDLLAASYTDGPMPTGDLVGISGTFFVPGEMIIVEVVNGVADKNTIKDFSGKTKKV